MSDDEITPTEIVTSIEINMDVDFTEEEWKTLEGEIGAAIKKQMIMLEAEFYRKNTSRNTRPTNIQPALYDQNYKSAVLDKYGRFVRKIE